MKQINKLLGARIEAISTNTFDNKLRITAGGKWFVEDENPAYTFGTPYEIGVSIPDSKVLPNITPKEGRTE